MAVMRRTVTRDEGSYTGLKCPACPAILQAVKTADGRWSERAGLQAHWVVCHPDRPMRQIGAR